MESLKSLCKDVYDFKFDTLIAPKIIRTLYAVLAILITIGSAILLLVLMPSTNNLSLLFMPIVWLVYMVIVRIAVESVIIKFQMAQDIREIKKKYVA